MTWRRGENTRAPPCNPTSSQLSRKMNSKSTIRLLSSASASRADRQRMKKRVEANENPIPRFHSSIGTKKNLLGRDRPLATRGRSSAAAAPARARKQENMQNCTMCGNRGSRIFLRSYMRRRNEATTSDGLCHSLRDGGISRRFIAAARAHQPPALLIRCRLYPRGDVII